MELRHLRYFIAVAEELHFGRAAKRLRMSQPPLSRQIKELEQEIGFDLFSRTKHKVALTTAGEYFLQKSYEVMEIIEQACEEGKRINNGQAGQLIIAYTGAISYEKLPTVISEFQDKYPNINIILKKMPTSEQIEALEKKLIHIGLVNLPVTSNQLNIEHFHSEPFVVVLPKSHRLAKQNKPIDLYELKNEVFITTPRLYGGLHNTILNICQTNGFTPKKIQETSDLPSAVSFVASNIGVSILPASIQFVKNDDIVYLPILNLDMYYKTGIAWNSIESTPAVNTFISFIKQNKINKIPS